jgi:hypothetical protein
VLLASSNGGVEDRNGLAVVPEALGSEIALVVHLKPVGFSNRVIRGTRELKLHLGRNHLVEGYLPVI